MIHDVYNTLLNISLFFFYFNEIARLSYYDFFDFSIFSSFYRLIFKYFFLVFRKLSLLKLKLTKLTIQSFIFKTRFKLKNQKIFIMRDAHRLAI